MGLLAWIILGGIAGAIAKRFLPGIAPDGLWPTIALGVIGGVVGGGVGWLFGIPINHFFSVLTWVLAVLGALAVLLVYRWYKETYGGGSGGTPKPGGGDHAKHP